MISMPIIEPTYGWDGRKEEGWDEKGLYCKIEIPMLFAVLVVKRGIEWVGVYSVH